MKIIGIVGSRRRNNAQDLVLVQQAFDRLYVEGDRIVSGGCSTGADSFAEEIAYQQQVPITIHYARWNKLGLTAGPVRNTDIAKDCDVLIACVAEDRTGGTEDTIKKAEKLGKRIVLV
jgi:hypothetical protein